MRELERRKFSGYGRFQPARCGGTRLGKTGRRFVIGTTRRGHGSFCFLGAAAARVHRVALELEILQYARQRVGCHTVLPCSGSQIMDAVFGLFQLPRLEIEARGQRVQLRRASSSAL